MRTGVSIALGLLLTILVVDGCGTPSAAPTFSAERECQRANGTWRGGFCDFSAGGGGY